MKSRVIHGIRTVHSIITVCGRPAKNVQCSLESYDVTCRRCRHARDFANFHAAGSGASTVKQKPNKKRTVKSTGVIKALEKDIPERLFVQRNTEFDEEFDPDDSSRERCVKHPFDVYEDPDSFAGGIGTSVRVAVYDFVGWSTLTTFVSISTPE